jgi:hypothetical protein
MVGFLKFPNFTVKRDNKGCEISIKLSSTWKLQKSFAYYFGFDKKIWVFLILV